MSDRELLELAAKAAGYVIELDMNWGTGGMPFFRMSGNKWNPLADDGDALRLAVKLHMTVRCYMGNTCAQIGVPGQPNAYVDETNHADPLAATRRAIVRAAAEIGKATP